MKKIKIVLVALSFLFVIGFSNSNVFAVSKSDLGSDALIGLGTGSYEIIVKQSTTVADIEKVLGKAKLVTPSAFGGNAYTFYTDDDYSNYLYIETTAEGRIISYGSVDNSYVTKTNSYGDAYDYYGRGVLMGCLFPSSSVIIGGVYYDRYAMFNGSSTDIINYYTENYRANPVKYNKTLSQHSILLYNALAVRIGKKSNLVFDEDFFYINEQLKESGSSIREYVRAMNKSTEFMRGLGVKEEIPICTSSKYLLNPMQFASIASSNKGINYDERCRAVFDYDIDRQYLTAVAIKENTFDRADTVTLTDLEKSRLSAGRYEYAQAIANMNKESEIYDIEPVTSPASGLVAGKLRDSKVQGITNYVNVIRAGAGLQKLAVNEDAFLVAQHISTLMTYRYMTLGLGIQHQPEKPDGVTDEYYKTAVGWGRGYAENLGFSATQTTVKTMMRYINMFVDDSSETPQYFSHRQKILNADYTEWGYGVSPVMFSNEFTGYKANDVYLEAWPAANGITFLETLEDPRFQWSAQFTDKYTVQTNTTATVTCLNTEDTWEFTEQKHNSDYWYQNYTNTISTLNNKVVIYDRTIIPYEGYVYEVTLHNIKENSTGKLVDYTYRAAFEYADENNYASTGSSIQIQVPEDLVKVPNTQNTYSLAVGKEYKLNAVIDTDIVDKKVTWISSSDAVTVTQNGIIVANRKLDEDVTITVSFDANNVTDEIVLRTIQIPINEVRIQNITSGLTITTDGSGNKKVTINYDKYNSDYFDLGAYIGPDNRTDMSEATWSVADSSVISKYNENGRFKIQKEGTTKITATAGGISDNVTVTVNVPIKSITLNTTNAIKNGNTADISLNGSTAQDQIVVSRTPVIDTSKINFTSSNTNVATVDANGLVTFKTTGTVTITAKSAENSNVSAYITYNVKILVTDIEDRNPSLDPKTVSVSDPVSDYFRCVPTNSPYANKVEIKVENKDTSDPDPVAKIENGMIYGLKAGECIVTETIKGQYTSTGRDITKSYELKVLNPIKSITFPSSVTVMKGEWYQLEPKLNPNPTSDDVVLTYSTDATNIFVVTGQEGLIMTKKVGKGDVTVRCKVNGSYKVLGPFTIHVNVVDFVKGDVNKDGVVDVIDAGKVLDIYKGVIEQTDELLSIGDMNNDGNLDVIDAGLILDTYKGLI